MKMLQVCLLSTALLGTPSFGFAEGDEPERGVDPVTQLLLDARRGATGVDELARRLNTDARANPEQLFVILSRGRFDIRVGERGQSERALSRTEREGLVRALGALPWRAYLADLLEGELEESERRTALELYAAHGTERDLGRLVAWCRPSGSERRVGRALRDAFADAFLRLADRGPAALRDLGSVYAAAHHSVVPVIIASLSARPSEDSLRGLVSCLGAVPAADSLIVTEIGHVARAVRLPVDPSLRERVRAYLGRSDPALVAAAILATERLDDADAVSMLADLLGFEDALVRQRAYAALRHITSEQLAPEAAAWREWHAAVQTWWFERAPELFAQARHGANAVASRAILELSKQRYYRHELAPRLTESLQQRNDEIVVLTCAALGHLGSPRSVRALVECLDDRSLDVRRAALGALRRITGQDHGEQSQGWRAAGW